jgi:hypothetical protein
MRTGRTHAHKVYLGQHGRSPKLTDNPFPSQVAPSSLIGQWGNEIRKWLSFRLPFTVVRTVIVV